MCLGWLSTYSIVGQAGWTNATISFSSSYADKICSVILYIQNGNKQRRKQISSNVQRCIERMQRRHCGWNTRDTNNVFMYRNYTLRRSKRCRLHWRPTLANDKSNRSGIRRPMSTSRDLLHTIAVTCRKNHRELSLPVIRTYVAGRRANRKGAAQTYVWMVSAGRVRCDR